MSKSSMLRFDTFEDDTTHWPSRKAPVIAVMTCLSPMAVLTDSLPEDIISNPPTAKAYRSSNPQVHVRLLLNTKGHTNNDLAAAVTPQSDRWWELTYSF